MTSSHERPQWARPDPPVHPPPDEGVGRGAFTGVPVDPARAGAPQQRDRAMPPGAEHQVPAGRAGSGGWDAPRWPGEGAHAGGGGAPQMLGDDKLAGAAQAAREHAAQRIIDTSTGRSDGLDKCPRCGSSDITYSISHRALVCAYCRNEWNEDIAEEAFGLDSSIAELQGHVMASGTADIQQDLTTLTLKCQGCGAEVVINVDEQLHARCHWCRQTLSVNTQIPNGAVPDAVLPFLLTREEAVERIDAFAGRRKAFAHARFKAEFVPDNVMGVYIPYMVVDGNLHAVLSGTGEVTTRQYTVRRKVGDNYVTETFYDADVYSVNRAFDLLVDDLTVESAQRFTAGDNSAATNNILSAVQPYDTQNAVAYNSNYLKGFTSERRDLDIRDVDDSVEDSFLAIARAKATPTVSRYDRGVRWESEGVAVHGTRWVAMYVPVWLYSYADSAKGEGALVHYIAVNARNGATMGSVPVSHPKIFAVACLAGSAAAAIAGLIGVGWFLAS